ncbi:MAG: hypothetical protein UX99_C0014G0012 [Candidatus Amesbacteria bacterium GW2011_GWB1_47_26]|uniref:Uncharacterized protein n=1 Tax=Candidatus Amesbacteria bacterium GW2011_GWC2_45_19 TaxID=1618366 RepID=A0A0G1Q2B3_9BACT|nr:MAG: hypothetical protein UX05_C0007G0029 [Candidatus Amesbacteria bacterium GW2011_GWC2_45_19]KKU37277.1 MAG: hypothetical protein UX52_C0030G0008 [Candidatus Amesbacteria bacterium GW2011_GWA1_46_35]KKU68380.1 MAG: hypothetical protein UX93_C0008G0029 [Microgenomates group bacterium GW2011_GWC1_47_20]KKU74454.1 MAG: hypothetical protein UX99_C0014G0012 [Candidatus Amesbacteria bacterium GW2011_GWB1_47_26]KKU79531.1 MAG: hypothetical protein UY06_C0019G0001 [Candidatus Amesbacteria bacteriu
MPKETNQYPDYRRIPIFNLTQEEIAVLISGSNGIYYIELVAVYPQIGGLGTVLHEIAFESILESSGGAKTILVITQNPAEILAFKKATNKLGQTCFPFDRPMNINEREVVNAWLSTGPVRDFRPRPEVNLDLGIFYNFFRNWQPQIDRNIKAGELQDFLIRNGTNFDEFCDDKNAFILGFSFSK